MTQLRNQNSLPFLKVLKMILDSLASISTYQNHQLMVITNNNESKHKMTQDTNLMSNFILANPQV